METHAELRQVTAAVGMPLVTCRLVVAPDVVRTRLVARHADEAATDTAREVLRRIGW
ncbi:hypothetical protein SAMN04488570_0914 [Nocardioides scoriae]|uniref:Uncharacterized protein n=1 Tax=Nocardioides scoriae TaxID=642780 RepID=A0A1H1NN01_9ACTN|nr:hypothetical protein SAMN04488570_0914 [Nocardioides scoriae]